MSDSSPPAANAQSFEQALRAAVDHAGSLKEIEAALQSQPGVRSVRLEEAFMKSLPPQRMFTIERCRPDGSTATAVLTFFDMSDFSEGGQRFRFIKLSPEVPVERPD